MVNISGGLVYVNDRVNGYRNADLLYVSGGSDEDDKDATASSRGQETEGQKDDEKKDATASSRTAVINENKTENTIQRRINKEGIEKNLQSRPKRISRSTDMGAVITTQYRRKK